MERPPITDDDITGRVRNAYAILGAMLQNHPSWRPTSRNLGQVAKLIERAARIAAIQEEWDQ